MTMIYFIPRTAEGFSKTEKKSIDDYNKKFKDNTHYINNKNLKAEKQLNVLH